MFVLLVWHRSYMYIKLDYREVYAETRSLYFQKSKLSVITNSRLRILFARFVSGRFLHQTIKSLALSAASQGLLVVRADVGCRSPRRGRSQRTPKVLAVIMPRDSGARRRGWPQLGSTSTSFGNARCLCPTKHVRFYRCGRLGRNKTFVFTFLVWTPFRH